MVAWYNVVALVLIALAVGYLYGRHWEFQRSISKRLEARDHDRQTHQRRTTEKNIGQRFANAIKDAIQYRFWVQPHEWIGRGYVVNVGKIGDSSPILVIRVDLSRSKDYQVEVEVHRDGHVIGADHFSVEEDVLKSRIQSIIEYLSKQRKVS